MHTIKIDDKEIQISDESFEAFREQFVTKSKRWKPSQDEGYWLVDNHGVTYSLRWRNDSQDYFLYDQQNCFKTEKEAEQHLQLLKAQAEIRNSSDFEPDWNDYDQDKYLVIYDHQSGQLRLNWYNEIQYPSLAHYPTREAAEQAIKDHKEAYLRVFGIKK